MGRNFYIRLLNRNAAIIQEGQMFKRSLKDRIARVHRILGKIATILRRLEVI